MKHTTRALPESPLQAAIRLYEGDIYNTEKEIIKNIIMLAKERER